MPEVLGTYSVDMWERLPADGNRYELLDGQLVVTPAPAVLHQLLVTRLIVALQQYVDTHHLGRVFPGIDLYHGLRTVLEPDVAVALGPEARRVHTWKQLSRCSILAIEIVSPSSARHDRGPKRDVYLAHGCEYWIVDPPAQLIERWLPGADGPAIHRDTLEWQPDPAIPPLVLDIVALFAELPKPEA